MVDLGPNSSYGGFVYADFVRDTLRAPGIQWFCASLQVCTGPMAAQLAS